MSRQSEGSVITRSDRPGLWARVTYSDNQGKRRVIQRKVSTRTEGKLLLKQLLRKIEDHGAQILDGDRMTFKELAKVYEEKRLFEPTVTPSGKVIGLKSYKSARRRLRNLLSYFGFKRIRSISHTDIEAYKRARMETPLSRMMAKGIKLEATITSLKGKRQRKDVDRDAQIARAETQLEVLKVEMASGQGSRTDADVNRDLQLLRNVFNFAVRQAWLIKNPFSQSGRHG